MTSEIPVIIQGKRGRYSKTEFPIQDFDFCFLLLNTDIVHRKLDGGHLHR